jgi:hypothetical protein
MSTPIGGEMTWVGVGVVEDARNGIDVTIGGGGGLERRIKGRHG